MGLLADATFYVLPLALLWTQMVQQASSVVRSQHLDNGTISSTTAFADCRKSCGDVTFQYPFGIGGSGCFRNRDFKLICNDTSQPPKLFLNDGTSQVVEDIITNDTQSFYQSTNLIRFNFSQTIPMRSGVDVYNMSWTAPAIAFSVANSPELNITGCNFDAYLVDHNSGITMKLCTPACTSADILETVARQNCNGSGCCSTKLLKVFRSFHLKFVRHSNGSLEPRSNRSSLWDEITVATEASIIWSIMDQPGCTRAMETKTDYACVSSNSRCIDDNFYSLGYNCRCNPGYAGNPYVSPGCLKQKEYNPNQRRANCNRRCGNIRVEFPFGMEEGCFASEQFHLNCANTTSSPSLQLDSNTVTEINVARGNIKIQVFDNQDDFVYHLSRGESLYVLDGDVGSLHWAVANLSCQEAKRHNSYACVDGKSTCIPVYTTDQGYIGYRCKCPDGFQGNPYVKSGCKDVRQCYHIKGFGCIKKNLLQGITIGAISGGFGILFTFNLIFLLRRRKIYVQKQARKKYFRQNHGLLLQQLLSSDQNASENTKIFSLEELEKATNNFDVTRILGHGGHGMVYKGILSNQRVVAIKKSKVIEDGEINQFINEVAILSQINHRNIVKLFGCCLETEVPLLVYDFIPNGSLFQILHADSNNGFSLSWDECLRIAIETAGALHYLHSAASISVFHRDVKTSNILLDEHYIAKVSDFGASRLVPIDQTHVVTIVQGTFGYLDPQYYHTGQLNEKSDVYSFGVVLLELLFRKKPIFISESGSKQNLANYFIWETKRRPITEIVSAQVLDEATEEEIKSVASLAETCLRLQCEERPTMKQVEMTLQSLRMKRLHSRDLAPGENEGMQPLMSARPKANCHSLASDSGDKANLTYQQSQSCDSKEQEQNLANYFIGEKKGRPINEIVSSQVLDEATEEEIKSVASLAETCLRVRGEERPTMKQVEMTMQPLRMKRLNSRDLAPGENEGMQPLMSVRPKANCHSLAIDSGDKANLTYQQSQSCDSKEQEYLSCIGLPR